MCFWMVSMKGKKILKLRAAWIYTALLIMGCLAFTAPAAAGSVFPVSEASVRAALGDREGALVVIDTDTGAINGFNPALASKKLAPCSTFKIWNTLIGLELDLIDSPDRIFYKWDGVKRWLPDWNRDLTLREAFQVSCVPAYQQLARRIGAERMRTWIDRIGYGDRDLSSGLDVFWLPEPGRKSLLITVKEQAQLMARLASGDVPFSAQAQATLKDIMTAEKTDRGTLYGKTGTGTDGDGNYTLGWYVGYVERDSKTYAFACVLKGQGVTGKDARAVVQTVLLQ